MFYTSHKLTNVFECVMFVRQFHVHCKIGTLIHRITFDSISNANSCQMIAKTTRKLSRVLFFIVNEGLFLQRLCKQTRRMHQRYFYSLRGIILRLQKEVIGSALENTFKNQEKEHSGHDENNFFFYSIFYFIQQLFLNPLFFAFLNQFTAGENLRVAGDSTGHRHILTTLLQTPQKSIASVRFSMKHYLHVEQSGWLTGPKRCATNN